MNVTKGEGEEDSCIVAPVKSPLPPTASKRPWTLKPDNVEGAAVQLQTNSLSERNKGYQGYRKYTQVGE